MALIIPMDQKASFPGKYLFVFLITLALFALAFLFSEFLYQKRVGQLEALESNIRRSILESEIQYALLADVACEDDGAEGSSSILIEEINRLATRLEYLEEQRGTDDPEVVALKKYYSLLQIKDYLLLRDRARLCNERPLTILYFYSNVGDCPDCKKMGYVLTSMREEYDFLHVYAFDYDLGLSVIETLKSIYALDGEVPIIVVNRKPYYGFKTREEVEELLPGLAEAIAEREAQKESATTTER